MSTPLTANARGQHASSTPNFIRFNVTSVTDYSPGAGPFAGKRVIGSSLARNSISGRVTAVSAFANDGGIFRSAGAGVSNLWAAANGGLSTLGFDDATITARSGGPGMKVSTDGGSTWALDPSLDHMMTQGNHYSHARSFAGCLLNAMAFVLTQRQVRFAMGSTGVYGTVDGTNWTILIADRSLPCAPTAAVYDDRVNRQPTLYVFCAGRGLLKLDLSLEN